MNLDALKELLNQQKELVGKCLRILDDVNKLMKSFQNKSSIIQANAWVEHYSGLLKTVKMQMGHKQEQYS